MTDQEPPAHDGGVSEDGPYACPCCACFTLDLRAGHEVCPVCSWEDDGQDSHDADEVRGGPNAALSLTQARRNYADFGACARSALPYVRPATREERGG